jgi:predicted transcriptional regulator
MDSALATIEPESTLLEAFERSEERQSRTLVVTTGGKACGVVKGDDVAKRVVADENVASTRQVHEIMATRVAACYDDTEVSQARAFAEEKNLEHLLVCNRKKQIIGVVAVAELMKEAS